MAFIFHLYACIFHLLITFIYHVWSFIKRLCTMYLYIYIYIYIYIYNFWHHWNTLIYYWYTPSIILQTFKNILRFPNTNGRSKIRNLENSMSKNESSKIKNIMITENKTFQHPTYTFYCSRNSVFSFCVVPSIHNITDWKPHGFIRSTLQYKK